MKDYMIFDKVAFTFFKVVDMHRKTSNEKELRQFFESRYVLDQEIEKYDEIMKELASISKVIIAAEASEEIARWKEL